jgi:molybdenum cofactor cytidylyltransferase
MMSAEKINRKSIGVILLAAGSSSRLGQPKQLLLYDDQSLLQHSIQAASASHAQPIIVVLGAEADRIKKEIQDFTVHVVVNADWEEGMASSIRHGIKELDKIHPLAEGVILMVCDQPFVTTSLLNDLMTAHQNTGKPIVTCSYADTYGPPALFHKSLFPELLGLKGDVGARSIVREHADEVEVVLFPEGNVDVDTEADYQKLLQGNRVS